MTRITRRAYVKKTGLAVAGLAMPHVLDVASASAPAVQHANDSPPLTDLLAIPVEYQLQAPQQVLQMDVSAATWTARFTQLVNQGYRPIWIQGSSNGANAATYSALWIRDGRSNWFEWQDLDESTYQSYFTSYASAGYRPISVSGYQTGGVNRFAAIWLHDPGTSYRGIHHATGPQYQTFVNDMIAANYIPQAVDGHALGTNADYISVWANTSPVAWEARHGLTSAQYQSEFTRLAGLGYRVTSLSAYQIQGTTYFAAYWVNDGIVDFIGSHDTPAATLFSNAAILERRDYHPVVIDGYDTGSTRHFAAVWIKRARTWTATGVHNASLSAFDDTMRTFMQARNIEAGALAVTRDSRLVCARGYRWDGYPENAVTPDSLFRIASLSKPLTSMAVMRLVQEGRLRLTDRLATLLSASLPAPLDSRMRDITVSHLLQHAGGWNRDTTFDPMFRDQIIAAQYGAPLPISRQHIVDYMTATQSLSFAPGTQMNYSNYGYLLLGRIIEAVTGMAYESYMQSGVFGPLGINRVVSGSTEFENRRSSEVAYFTGGTTLEQNVRQAGAPVNAMAPYGAFNVENMDAHGGWLASAVDLACFATAFDATGLYPVLNQSSIDTTFAVPSTGVTPGGSWYGCGWLVRSASGGLNTWHDGSLPGTSTLMVRRFDGLNWVVLFNRRDDPSGLSYGDIDSALHAAANSVTDWPAADLFASHGLPSRRHAFTDDPLIARVTPVKSVHLNELRARIGWARARRGLAPFPYSEAITAGTIVKVSHLTELRSALAGVYAALGVPSPAYTDQGLAAGMPIKVVHISELRAAVRVID